MTLMTMTDNVGSGGRDIAERVARVTGVPLYDDQRLQAAALEMGIPPTDVDGIDERAPGLFDRILSRKPDVYLELMESVVLSVARRGEGIIIGHGSQMLLRDFECAFHVRIFSPRPRRLRRVMESRGLQKEAADRWIRQMDSRREGFFRFAFHRDREDPTLYDLIINTAKIGTQAAADLVVSSVQNPLVSECTLGALEAMDRLSLVKRIEALLLDKGVDLSLVTIEVLEDGILGVTGLVSSEAVRKAAPGWIREVVGDRVVADIQLSLIPASY